MRRKIIFITVILLGATGWLLAQVNLLSNPGFENGLSSWRDLYGYPSQISRTVFHSGNASVSKSVGAVSEQEYWSQIVQDVNYAAGEPVYASLYAKTDISPEATARAGLMVQFLDGNNNIIEGTLKGREVGGSTNWRLLEVSAATVPAGTVKARISGYLWAAQDDHLSLNGKAYFDDAVFLKEYRNILPQRTLLNPGFENGLNDWRDLSGYPSSLTKAIVHAGTYAAEKKVATVSERDYWSQIYQEIACKPFWGVTAGLYVKTGFSAEAAGRAGVLLEFLDANGRLIYKYSRPVGGNTPWQLLGFKNVKAPKNTVKVRLSGFIYAPMGDSASLNAPAYFDDAVLALSVK